MKGSEEKELKSHLRAGDLKEAFEITRTEEERAKDKSEVVTVKYNEEELRLLDHQMELLDTNVRGAVIKLLSGIGWKVLRDTLGEEHIKWVSRKDRSRWIGPKRRIGLK